jgi:UDP-arabinose 4-epimerase
VQALAKAELVPVVYGNLTAGHDWAVKRGPLERGDLIDRDRLRAVLTAYKPVAVLHFAAYAYVGESVTEPGKYYAHNISGTLSLLSSLREVGPKAIVFSSSCAVYGNASLKPICEDDEMRPVNPYGFSKLAVERMLRDFGHAYGLRSVSLRYFNASGADPDGDIGRRPLPGNAPYSVGS